MTLISAASGVPSLKFYSRTIERMDYSIYPAPLFSPTKCKASVWVRDSLLPCCDDCHSPLVDTQLSMQPCIMRSVYLPHMTSVQINCEESDKVCLLRLCQTFQPSRSSIILDWYSHLHSTLFRIGKLFGKFPDDFVTLVVNKICVYVYVDFDDDLTSLLW